MVQTFIEYIEASRKSFRNILNTTPARKGPGLASSDSDISFGCQLRTILACPNSDLT